MNIKGGVVLVYSWFTEINILSNKQTFTFATNVKIRLDNERSPSDKIAPSSFEIRDAAKEWLADSSPFLSALSVSILIEFSISLKFSLGWTSKFPS